MKLGTSCRFPLFERAITSGTIETGNAFIVGPTFSGKSHIGRAIIRNGLARKELGVHVYLVPYSTLAEAARYSLDQELAKKGLSARLKIATGDRLDSCRPEDADILVCTFERFRSILRNPNLILGRVVIDDIHLLADRTKGPLLEELLIRMKLSKQPRSLCAISAIIPNAQSVATWLGIPLLRGSKSDTAAGGDMSLEVAVNVDRSLERGLKRVLAAGGRAIVYCDSKSSAQKCARHLNPVVRKYVGKENKASLNHLASAVIEDVDDTAELNACIPNGIAALHTLLSHKTRQQLERSFQEGALKVITIPHTMAGTLGVTASSVFVQDVFRTEFVRGMPLKVLLSSGELVNLLGHAGDVGGTKQDSSLLLIQKRTIRREEQKEMREAINAGRATQVNSRLPDSFDALMHLLLSVIADRGTVTIDLLGEALKQSFWYQQHPTRIAFDRELKSDIMEEITSFRRVPRSMHVVDNWLVPDGVVGIVKQGPKKFNVSLRVTGMECSCTKGEMVLPTEVCKHLACAVRHFLFDVSVGDEERSRAIYAATDLFRRTLDLGTKIREAVGLLRMWRMVEMVPGGFRATPLGNIASNTNLDLLLARTVGGRVLDLSTAPTTEFVLTWLTEDYFPEGQTKTRWIDALESWIKGTEVEKMKLPYKDRASFYEGVEQLARIAGFCAEIADQLEKREIAQIYRTAGVCLRWGVAPELAPLASASIPELGRRECRYLYSDCGIHTIVELAKADPLKLAGRRASPQLTQEWVERARNLVSQS